MDSTNFLAKLMDIRDQSEFYGDLHSRTVLFGLSLPPFLPESLLSSPNQAFPPNPANPLLDMFWSSTEIADTYQSTHDTTR
jgi:hypothetical protein